MADKKKNHKKKDDKKKRRAPAPPRADSPAPARAAPAPAPARPTPALAPARAPAPARTSSPRVGQTATRPVAAKTPTRPPRRTDAPGWNDSDTADTSDIRARSAGAATHAIPKLSHADAHYTKPKEVPLRPGQTLGYTAGKGYYATTRPKFTKASTTPRSRTAKVTAMSTKADTRSPLVEHRETRDGRTTVRLSHATKPSDAKASQERKVAAHASKRSAKPTHEPSRRAAVETKKASSRVHEQLAKNKERSHHAKSGIGHHPGHKGGPRGTAASVDDARRSRADDDSGFANNPLFAPFLRFHPWAQWEKSVTFPAGAFTAETTAQASTGTGMSVRQKGDELTVTYGGQKLYAMSLGTFSAGALHIAETAYAVAQKLKKDATDIVTKTVHVDGGDLAVSPSGIAYTKTTNGVTTTVRSNWLGQLVVSINYTARPPAPRPPLATRPIHISVTTTITPKQTQPGQKRQPPVTAPAKVREPAHQQASNKSDFDAIFAPTPNQAEKALGWLAGGVVGLGGWVASQVEGSGSPVPVPMAGVGHPPKNVA